MTRLRVAHCVGFYFPDHVGGTEVYVQDLLVELGKRSIDGHVVAATDGEERKYEWEGVQVARYPRNWAKIQQYGANGQGAGLSKFQELVLEKKPDIFHLHSWTSAASLAHLAQIAQLGIPCVVTMHVPSALCMRGTMLLHGRQACDGVIDEKRCTRCWSEFRGVPSSLAYALSHLPRMSFGVPASTNKIVSRAVKMLSIRTRAVVQARELHEMADLSEMIVAPSAWVHSSLLANGIPRGKLTVSRQGVTGALVREAAAAPPVPASSNEVRVGFIGRLERYKGAHILVQAMNQLPQHLPIRLMIAGYRPEQHYLRQLMQASDGDKRIEFLGQVSRDEVPDFMRRLDVLAVPSNCLETGPLVVLEGQVFGLPVMGADLGGISERIRTGIDGWLLPFDDSGAWAKALQEAVLDRAKLARLAANVLPPRTMSDVAADMSNLYRTILASCPAQIYPAE